MKTYTFNPESLSVKHFLNLVGVPADSTLKGNLTSSDLKSFQINESNFQVITGFVDGSSPDELDLSEVEAKKALDYFEHHPEFLKRALSTDKTGRCVDEKSQKKILRGFFQPEVAQYAAPYFVQEECSVNDFLQEDLSFTDLVGFHFGEASVSEWWQEAALAVLQIQVGPNRGAAVLVSADGVFTTAAHMMPDPFVSSIFFINGKESRQTQIELLDYDPQKELARFKIDDTDMIKGITPVTLASRPVSVGEEVVAVGFPESQHVHKYFSFGMVVGQISGRELFEQYFSDLSLIPMHNGTGASCIQLKESSDYYLDMTADLEPGYSGGAVFNKYGELVGINSSSTFGHGFASVMDEESDNSVIVADNAIEPLWMP